MAASDRLALVPTDALVPSDASQALVLADARHEQTLATLDNDHKRKAKWPGQSAPKKGKRWGLLEDKPFKPLPYVDLPVGLSEKEIDQFLREQRLEDLHRKIQMHQLEDVEPDIRPPSPPPLYDRQGNRLNTRDMRIRKAMVAEYSRLVRYMMKAIEGYQAPADWRPQKLIKKIIIPYEKFPQAPFMGVIIGARGVNHKRLQESTGCRIFIRGRDIGDRWQTDEELQMLQHVHIEADTEEQIAAAEEVIMPLLNPESPEFEYARTHGMTQLATVNGFTLKKTEQRCGICGALGHLGFECPETGEQNYKMANVTCSICGDKGHVSTDCKVAAEKREKDSRDWKEEADKREKMEVEYSKMMDELGIQAPKSAHPQARIPGAKAPRAGLGYRTFAATVPRPGTSVAAKFPALPAPQTSMGGPGALLALRPGAALAPRAPPRQPMAALATPRPAVGLPPRPAPAPRRPPWSTPPRPRPPPAQGPTVNLSKPISFVRESKPEMPVTVGTAPTSTSVTTSASSPTLPSAPSLQCDSQQVSFAHLANPLGHAAEVDDSLVCPPGLVEYLHSWTLDEMTQETGAHVALSSSGVESCGARVVITGSAEARARAKLHVQAWMDVNIRMKGLIGPAAGSVAPPAMPSTEWPPSNMPDLLVNGNCSGLPDGFPPLSYPSPGLPDACAMPLAGFPPAGVLPEGFPPGMCPLPDAGFPPGMSDLFSPASVFSSQEIPSSGLPPGVSVPFGPMINCVGVSGLAESSCALGGNLGVVADFGGLSAPPLHPDNGNVTPAPGLGLIPPGMSEEAFDEL